MNAKSHHLNSSTTEPSPREVALVHLPRNSVATLASHSPASESVTSEPDRGVPTLGPHRSLSKEIVQFGPFRLRAAERLLEKDGIPISLGSRALDILIALVERAAEVVNKRDLIARVWPDLVVEEGSLRFHIAVLRKALGDGQSGARYVSNIAGRGYCFVAPISRSTVETVLMEGVTMHLPTHLPSCHSQILGRDEVIKEVSNRLRSHRLVSLVASGGTGKTAVAVSVAHLVRQEFGEAIYFLDLGSRIDPLLACRELASALGVSVSRESWLLDLLRLFRDRRVLLVLDSCEHMIDAAAALAELLLRAAPQVHMLATSRELLRVEGEQIVHLPPLKCPPASPRLQATEAMSYSAVRVFMKRFAAGAHPFELTDEVTPAVSEICRRLDGIALAIELAARRVEAYGLQATIALLDSPSRLFWSGEGSRSGRHRTLHATLDWSYSLLSPFERQTLRRLSVFGGMFSLEAAQSISDVDADHTQLTSTIAALVEKSLVITDTAAKTKRYRLIETMRIYLLLKLAESGERHLIARRHAIYCAELLASDERLPAMYAQHEPDVRAALQWSFSEEGDFGLGTALLTGSIPLLSRSLFEASVSRSD